MFRAGPPSGGAVPARLWVSGTGRLAFDEASDSARDPALRAYMTDMLRPYGLPLAEEELTSGQSYGEMAGALLAAEVAAESPVDLLVFAFATPDVAPWRATASYLSNLCPGRPFAFAVCDQGVTAPFTALRLILEYARTGGCQRALLVIAEQAAMPYQPTVPVTTPGKHAVVTLVCDQSGQGGRLESVRLHPGVTSPEAGRLLADAIADLSAGHDVIADLSAGHDVIAVVGASLSALSASLPGQVVSAPAEQPCTGVWWEAASAMPGWAAHPARVLLADYDPLLGNLCMAVIEVPGGR